MSACGRPTRTGTVEPHARYSKRRTQSSAGKSPASRHSGFVAIRASPRRLLPRDWARPMERSDDRSGPSQCRRHCDRRPARRAEEQSDRRRGSRFPRCRTNADQSCFVVTGRQRRLGAEGGFRRRARLGPPRGGCIGQRASALCLPHSRNSLCDNLCGKEDRHGGSVARLSHPRGVAAAGDKTPAASRGCRSNVALRRVRRGWWVRRCHRARVGDRCDRLGPCFRPLRQRVGGCEAW